MTKIFQPNIGKAGRIIRGIIGLLLIGAAIAAWTWHWLAGVGLAGGGVFCLFEAMRGWCVARACGVRTRW
jgi:hypothetical protein